MILHQLPQQFPPLMLEQQLQFVVGQARGAGASASVETRRSKASREAEYGSGSGKASYGSIWGSSSALRFGLVDTSESTEKSPLVTGSWHPRGPDRGGRA
ncbi:hypothetical protein GCM10010349_78440 [Streptomyces flavofungini]|nr:hypothetical protein GCM10010349_78440 [Streptomyces flavofungini]